MKVKTSIRRTIFMLIIGDVEKIKCLVQHKMRFYIWRIKFGGGKNKNKSITQ